MSASSGSVGYPLAEATEAFRGALGAGCYTESGTTITYDCDDGGYAIKGTVTLDGDTIAIDLTMTSAQINFDYEGTITVTDTSVDGYLDLAYDIDQGGMQTNYTINIKYNSVVLTEGCPTAGSLNIDVDIDTAGLEGLPAGAASAYDFPSVTINFGPACGDTEMF